MGGFPNGTRCVLDFPHLRGDGKALVFLYSLAGTLVLPFRYSRLFLLDYLPLVKYI